MNRFDLCYHANQDWDALKNVPFNEINIMIERLNEIKEAEGKVIKKATSRR